MVHVSGSVCIDAPSISRAQVILRGRVLAKPFEALIRFQINRVGPRTLAAFKYLVEHGQPPPGRHANLPKIPVAC